MVSTAITPQALNADAFARKVIEGKLYVVGPYDGRHYAAHPGRKEDVLYVTGGGNPINPVTIAISADPAAGANPVAWTCPVGKRWKIKSLIGVISTAVAGANRHPYAAIRGDGTNMTGLVIQAAAIIASQTNVSAAFVKDAAPGGLVTSNTGYTNPLGDITLEAGGSIQMLALNLQAADDWTAAILTYEEITI